MLSTIGSAESVDWTEIVTAVSHGEPIQKKKVSASWLNQVREARSARDRAVENYLDIPAVISVGLEADPNNDFSDGRSGFQISIEVDEPLEQSSHSIPDHAEGVKINKTRNNKQRGFSACERKSNYDPVPGGVYLEETGADGGGQGSLGCRVQKDGKEFMITARHVLDQNMCDSLPESTAYQYGDALGKIGHNSKYNQTNQEYTNQDEDWVLIDPSAAGSLSLSNGIADGYNYTTSGHMTSSGVADEASASSGSKTTMHSVGNTTGYTTGTIQKMNQTTDYVDCVDFNGHGIKYDIRNGTGDSGGPIYQRNDRYEINIMNGIFQQYEGKVGEKECFGTQTLSDTAYGIAAYHLNNDSSISFGDPNP